MVQGVFEVADLGVCVGVCWCRWWVSVVVVVVDVVVVGVVVVVVGIRPLRWCLGFLHVRC